MRSALSMIEALGGIELRCPDCASPEVDTSSQGTDPERELRCTNCGARFASGSTFTSLADCEALIAEAEKGSSASRQRRGDRR